MKSFLLAAALIFLAACTSGRSTADLGGTTWQLTAIDGEAPVAAATLTFDEAASTISGSTGCNTYSAPVEVGGGAIAVEQLITTKMACGEPRGIMQQEARFTTALRQAESYEVRGNTLTITAPRGESGRALTLIFERQ